MIVFHALFKRNKKPVEAVVEPQKPKPDTTKRLSKKVVGEIQALAIMDVPYRKIGQVYGVHHTTVSRIARGVTHRGD